MKNLVLSAGIFIGLSALSSHAAIEYIGEVLGPEPIGGTIAQRDISTSIWDLGGLTITLSPGTDYVLDNAVFVRNGTLVIESGTIIRGQPRSDAFTVNPGALVITRTAKIYAEDVIFTTASTRSSVSTSTTGSRASGAFPAFWDLDPVSSPRALVQAGTSSNGLWGGLIILGNAPTNVDRNMRSIDNGGATGGAYDDASRISFAEEYGGSVSADDRPAIEGSSTGTVAHTTGADRYGGKNPLDNSGVLRRISVRHAGAQVSSASSVEHNGLSLYGVGAGTLVDGIEIYGSADDGVEISGGAVNAKRLLILGVEDDMLDLDIGYTGFVQFVFGVGWGVPSSGSFIANHTDRAIEWEGSYHCERPEGFRVSPEASQSISSGGIGPVTINGSPVAAGAVLNATFISNTYTGPSIGTPGNDHDRSRGIMIRDRAAPRLLNSIILPRTYGARISYRLPLDPEDAIFHTNLVSNTFYKPSAFTCVDFIGQGLAQSASSNNCASADNTTSEIQTRLCGFNNLFNVNPGFAVAVNESLTSGTINPRPTDGYDEATSAPVVAAPLGAGAEDVSYRGAFNPDPTGDLWTSSWTAAWTRGLVTE